MGVFYVSSPPLILHRDTNYEGGQDLDYYRSMTGFPLSDIPNARGLVVIVVCLIEPPT
jgi:hypothetical protein